MQVGFWSVEAPYMRHGVWENSWEIFLQIPQTGRNHAFSVTKKRQCKREFNTKTARTRKADIKNSDNTPHISMDTRGLGVDLVGGIW